MRDLCRVHVFAWLAILTVFFGTVGDGYAQGTRGDYERAMGLREATANKVFKDRVRPHWLEDGPGFWYRNNLADGKRRYILVDAESGTRQPAFDHQRLAAALGLAGDEAIDSDKLDIGKLTYVDSNMTLQFTGYGKRWRCDLDSYALRELAEDEVAGESLAPQREGLRSRRTGEETSITFINRTEGKVSIFWVESGGGRRAYGTVEPGQRRRQHTFAGHVWLVTDEEGKTIGVFVATEDEGDAIIDPDSAREALKERTPKATRPRGKSPDGQWSAFIKDQNLHVHHVETEEEEVALTDDGTEEDAYSERFHWSPDSTKLVVLRVRDGFDRKVHLIESSPEGQLQPKLHAFDYRKPGDEIPIRKPHLFDVVNKRRVEVSDELFPNPWSISEIHWWPDSSRFSFLYNQRGHQVLRIISVDAESGQARTIVDERSDTFIDYAGKRFLHYLDSTDEIVWMSERDGWNHLYLYDAQTGRVKNQITKGHWVVRGVERVDAEKRQVWFRAGGIRPGQDPYYIHFCRVNFDGTGLVVLTEGDGTHDVTFSPDRRFLLDRWSRVDLPPVTELRSADDGRLVCELERADWDALLATGWRAPERFVAKARDGKTDIYGIIIRPSRLDPDIKYPVIEQIYAGPQGAFVPKSFGLQTKQHGIAELGFIVVQMDGMGTSHRSKAFHDVCWKNLGDSGFPDR
ncbi:MAG: DPP IV N-terminal domain-containing protein, partial [Planctomycetota bacterium]